MPATQTIRTPKFRLHKPTRQGFVELDGRRIYLGRFDLPETKQRYHRTLAEWIANGRRMPVAPEETTVIELYDAFMEHAKVPEASDACDGKGGAA